LIIFSSSVYKKLPVCPLNADRLFGYIPHVEEPPLTDFDSLGLPVYPGSEQQIDSENKSLSVVDPHTIKIPSKAMRTTLKYDGNII
jgi:hypothetical protein